MARYSLLFAGIHFPSALAAGLLMDYLGMTRASGLGHGITIAAAGIVGLRFVRTYRRQFSVSERRRLVAGCLCYLTAFEAFALWGNLDELKPLPNAAWYGVAAFTIGVNFAMLWISFKWPVRKMMEARLKKLAAKAA